jgi:DNA-directed RNA polymerase subunit RPC12/RpoP
MPDKKSVKEVAVVPNRCPHCGEKLTQWEQVLLNVDRALMCKSCWYRIIIPVDNEADERKE